MRRLLLNSLVLSFWLGSVFLSCTDCCTREKTVAGNASDTTGKSRTATGNAAKANESNTVNPGNDTALRYKTEIRNNGPDQAKTDSIKNAKTRKKK
jgi:hypothetical protein